MHHAGDRHPIFEFFVDDRVAADYNSSGLSGPLRAAADDLAQHLEVQLALRERDDIQRRLRLGAHRVDVTQRVGRRHLAENVRVVNDGREKVHGVDDGEIRPQAEYSCIVGRFRTDNHVGRFKRCEAVQHLQQVGRAELRRSTSGRDSLRQSHLLESLASRDFHHDGAFKLPRLLARG